MKVQWYNIQRNTDEYIDVKTPTDLKWLGEELGRLLSLEIKKNIEYRHAIIISVIDPNERRTIGTALVKEIPEAKIAYDKDIIIMIYPISLEDKVKNILSVSSRVLSYERYPLYESLINR